ncbi:MAG: S4 domain-containing protein [Candidatus Aenigmatarchaeota archaeon]
MRTKRLTAPKWTSEKKSKKYSISPLPGPHKKMHSIPAGTMLRDILKHAETLSEAKEILRNGYVSVNGIVVKRHRFPIGLMDVVSVGNDNYRVLPSRKKLLLKKVNDGNIRLLRIENKKTLAGGKTQLNLHAGINMLADGDYKSGDTITYNIKTKAISLVKFEKKCLVLVVHGKSAGMIGKIIDMIQVKGSQPNRVLIDSDGKTLELPESYVFAVGSNKPVVEL